MCFGWCFQLVVHKWHEMLDQVALCPLIVMMGHQDDFESSPQKKDHIRDVRQGISPVNGFLYPIPKEI